MASSEEPDRGEREYDAVSSDLSDITPPTPSPMPNRTEQEIPTSDEPMEAWTTIFVFSDDTT